MRNLVIKEVYGTEQHIQSLIDQIQPIVSSNSKGQYELSITYNLSPSSSTSCTSSICHNGSLNLNDGLGNWQTKIQFGDIINNNRGFHMTAKGKQLWDKFTKDLEAAFIDWIKSN